MPQRPDWLNGFSAPFKNAVMAAMEAAESRRVVAALDADGTLWRNDIGEYFLRWLSGNEPNDTGFTPLDASVWTTYETMLRTDRRAAYAFAIQSMAGLPLQDLMFAAADVASTWKYYKPKMADVINGLMSNGVEVYIVTASWAPLVRLAVQFLDADVLGVFGIESEVEYTRDMGPVLTSKLLEPVTVFNGKVEVLDQVVGQLPNLVIGDSIGDNEMLDVAEWPVVVGHASDPENEMMKLAGARGWARHKF